MKYLEISNQLVHQHIFTQRIQIENIAEVIAISHGSGQLVEVSLYIVLVDRSFIPALTKVRELNVGRQLISSILELIRLVVVGIKFNEGCLALIFQFNTVRTDIHLLGEVVVAAVFAVDVEVDRDNIVGSLSTHYTRHFHTDGIGEQ